jgi:hypothetical protein
MLEACVHLMDSSGSERLGAKATPLQSSRSWQLWEGRILTNKGNRDGKISLDSKTNHRAREISAKAPDAYVKNDDKEGDKLVEKAK